MRYRNQFETRTSGGTLNGQVRKMWERGMFGAICDSLRNSERVKYGACNLTNDPNGVRKAHHYGDSFFQLNENVRCRTSICNMDSGSGYGNTNLQIGTLSHCMHVLEKLPQQEIKSIINVMSSFIYHEPCGGPKGPRSALLFEFKWFQIYDNYVMIVHH